MEEELLQILVDNIKVIKWSSIAMAGAVVWSVISKDIL